MSTDKQDDSPARQRRDIEDMATRHEYRILAWYEDHGLTGTESANRPEFKRLLENAKGGKFQAVLLSEQSRMSREDIFDVMIHWRLLRDAGVLRVGTHSRGKFSSVAEDGLIVVENAHEPLIEPAEFERVQQIIQRRKELRSHSRAERYILNTIVTCQHCGNRMYGVRKAKRDRHSCFYQCNSSPTIAPYDPDCPHPAVRSERLEAYILEMIRTRLLNAGAEQMIRQAIVRAKRKDKTHSSRDKRQLAELRRKIERGTENLALAASEDFVAISKLLTQWREQETTLAERVEQRGRELEPLPEAPNVLARIREVPGNLTKADKSKLAHAIRQTVASITIGTRPARTGGFAYREQLGELRFHDAFGIKPIHIPDEAIAQRRIWREVGELAQRSSKPIHLADVCKMIDSPDPSHACYHMRKAVKAGLVRKIWHQGGWVAPEEV